QILILEVIGVFPDVNTQHRLTSCKVRRVLIRRGIDGQLAILHQQPGPSGAEAPQARSLELILKSGEGTEARGDGSGQIALGLAASALLHQLPEERMVPVAAAIVADGIANVLRQAIQALE